MAFAITANFLLGTYQGSDSGGRPEPYLTLLQTDSIRHALLLHTTRLILKGKRMIVF